MILEIYPIAFTIPDWHSFIKVCQDTLNFSPTRGLDEAGLDPKSLASYLACLDLRNQPLESLRQGILNPCLKHVSFSFLCVVDRDMIPEFNFLNLTTSYFTKNRKHLLLVTGTMEQWLIAIARGCQSSSDFGIREICNRFFVIFKAAGFRDLWQGYDEQDNYDGTIILKRIRG